MNKQALRDRLYDLAKRVSEGRFPSYGICHAVAFHVNSCEHRDCREWLVENFKRWPEYSGDISYPVPASCGLDIRPMQAFVYMPLWEAEYGAARSRLLTFLIGQINVELASEV